MKITRIAGQRIGGHVEIAFGVVREPGVAVLDIGDREQLAQRGVGAHQGAGAVFDAGVAGLCGCQRYVRTVPPVSELASPRSQLIY